jgi:hypothetical protein
LIACEVALKLKVCARQSNNFFRHERFTYTSIRVHKCEPTLMYAHTQTQAYTYTHIHTHMRHVQEKNIILHEERREPKVL